MSRTRTSIAIGLILLLSVSLLSGCSSGGSPAAETATPQESSAAPETSVVAAKTSADSSPTMTDPVNKQIAVPPAPDGWTAEENDSFVAIYTKDTAIFTVKLEVFAGTTLDEMTAQDMDELKIAFDEAQFSDPENVKIGGHDAVKIVYVDGEGPTAIRNENYIVLSGELSYIITCMDLDSAYNTAGFDNLLNGITFG